MIVQADFKFNIGDVVTHKTMAPPYLAKSEEGKSRFGEVQAQLLTIMGRVYDECPGGVQKHYRVRITSQGGWSGQNGITKDMFQFHEEELVAL